LFIRRTRRYRNTQNTIHPLISIMGTPTDTMFVQGFSTQYTRQGNAISVHRFSFYDHLTIFPMKPLCKLVRSLTTLHTFRVKGSKKSPFRTTYIITHHTGTLRHIARDGTIFHLISPSTINVSHCPTDNYRRDFDRCTRLHEELR
jgi:hypothetical protein